MAKGIFVFREEKVKRIYFDGKLYLCVDDLPQKISKQVTKDDKKQSKGLMYFISVFPYTIMEAGNTIHIAGKLDKETIKMIEKETGKKVSIHDDIEDIDSPQKDEELSEFNKALKRALEYSSKKDK